MNIYECIERTIVYRKELIKHNPTDEKLSQVDLLLADLKIAADAASKIGLDVFDPNNPNAIDREQLAIYKQKLISITSTISLLTLKPLTFLERLYAFNRTERSMLSALNESIESMSNQLQSINHYWSYYLKADAAVLEKYGGNIKFLMKQNLIPGFGT